MAKKDKFKVSSEVADQPRQTRPSVEKGMSELFPAGGLSAAFAADASRGVSSIAQANIDAMTKNFLLMKLEMERKRMQQIRAAAEYGTRRKRKIIRRKVQAV